MPFASRATRAVLAAEEATPVSGPRVKVLVTTTSAATVAPVTKAAVVVVPTLVRPVKATAPRALSPPSLAAVGGPKASKMVRVGVPEAVTKSSRRVAATAGAASFLIVALAPKTRVLADRRSKEPRQQY